MIVNKYKCIQYINHIYRWYIHIQVGHNTTWQG